MPLYRQQSRLLAAKSLRDRDRLCRSLLLTLPIGLYFTRVKHNLA
ncbi:hypothetical protein [Chamaesiphon minutus]|nr:hypothetical protein [Chamaesiphon minutus]